MKANMTLNREKQGANTVDALSDNTVSHQQLIKTHISQYIYIKEKYFQSITIKNTSNSLTFSKILSYIGEMRGFIQSQL